MERCIYFLISSILYFEIAFILFFRNNEADNADQNTSITIRFPQIVRNKKAQIYTKTSKKDYTVFYNKARVLTNYSVEPFGYCK